MYGFGELRITPQKRGDSETMPYVAQELSWELARYLDAEPVSESASATRISPAVTRPRPKER